MCWLQRVIFRQTVGLRTAGGQAPTLLLHGSTKVYKIDRIWRQTGRFTETVGAWFRLATFFFQIRPKFKKNENFHKNENLR